MGDAREVRTVALLLAGGTGTRLYPASRPDRPKQFLELGGERSLLRRTADRAAFADAVYAATTERHRERVGEAVPEATVLTDPGLDTGPALVAATHEIAARASGPVVVCCLPTDHHVSGDFAATMDRAARVAADTEGLVCVGVDPDRPATGYGYIDPETPPETGGHARVAQFREKPAPERARQLVERGCLWNAGMFAWTPAALLQAARASPLAPLVDALDRDDPDAGFEAVPATSVDYAILERADDVYVVPADFEWDDLGTWDAVGRLATQGGSDALTADDAGNALLGDGLAIDATENVVVGEDAHVSVLGVDGLAVVAAGDRVLVVDRAAADRVRAVVSLLRERGEW